MVSHPPYYDVRCAGTDRSPTLLGNLALSRALGDFEFKQSPALAAENQVVTADPEMLVHEATSEDEFLVIACDGKLFLLRFSVHFERGLICLPGIVYSTQLGIWDVLSSQQVIDFVRRAICDRKELNEICEELMDRCLAPDSDWGGVGCDNMTAMIVAIKGTRSKVEWYDWIKSRVEGEVGYKTPKEITDPFSQGPKAGVLGSSVGSSHQGESEEESEEESEIGAGEEAGKAEEAEKEAIADGTKTRITL